MVDRRKVRELMLQKGLKVVDLHRLTGLSSGHISDILTGRRRHLSARTLYVLAKALGVTVEDLLDTQAREDTDALASN